MIDFDLKTLLISNGDRNWGGSANGTLGCI